MSCVLFASGVFCDYKTCCVVVCVGGGRPNETF